MKRLLALVLVLMLSLGAFALAEDNSLAAVQEKGTLILGLDDSFPPMGYRDNSNNIVGYDIDLATEVASRLGVTLVCQPVDWSAKEVELNSGNIDCIWNGMSITPERQENMAMTWSYMNNKIMVYAKNDSGIASKEDMAGKVVGVQAGSFAEEVIDTYEDYEELRASIGEVVAYEDYLTALIDLQMGNIDALLIDLVVAQYKLAGMEDDSIVAVEALEDDNYGIGFRKDDIALRDAVQDTLVEMAKDGTIAAISEVWFGEDISTVPVA